MFLRHAPRGAGERESPGWRWPLLLLIILLLTLLTMRAVRAEDLGPGGGSRLILGDELVGPYRILATSSPNPATKGVVTYVVRVTDPTTGERVRDAQIEIELRQADGAAVVRDSATHDDAGNDIDYAAHISLEQEGSWNGVLRVTGSRGTSETAFVQNVTPQRTLSTVILVGIPFVVMLAVFGAVYFVRSGGRKPVNA